MSNSDRAEYLKKWHSTHHNHEKQYYNSYVKSHRDKINQKMRQYRLRVKLEVLSNYANGNLKCSCCGESMPEFLTLDHINEGGRKEKIRMGLEDKSSTAFYLMLKKLGFPSASSLL